MGSIRYKFEPASGVILPKQKLNISFNFSPLKGPLIDLIFKCEVEGLDFPLGVNLLARVIIIRVFNEFSGFGPRCQV